MSEGLNRAMLLGNLGVDPELKFTQGGQAVLRMRIATTTSYYDSKSQTRKEQTDWHTVSLWGKRAESLNKLLGKGSRVYVEGRVVTRSWDDAKTGEKRYATEVNADNVILCDGKGGGGESRADGGQHRERTGGYEGAGGGGDDDIPFAQAEHWRW